MKACVLSGPIHIRPLRRHRGIFAEDYEVAYACLSAMYGIYRTTKRMSGEILTGYSYVDPVEFVIQCGSDGEGMIQLHK